MKAMSRVRSSLVSARKCNQCSFPLIAAAALAIVFAPVLSAFAQERPSLTAPRSPAEIIAMFDTNGDKRIDRTELRLKIVLAFDQFDTDRDGSLTRAELPGISSGDFAAADTDKDGKLSLYEYSQAEFLQFSAIDANNDGFITAEEIRGHQERSKSR